MRRNLRLAISLLLLSGLYIFTQRSINGSSTLQKNTNYSVSDLTRHLSVFVPASFKTRSPTDVQATNGNVTVIREINPRHLRNINFGIHSKAKVKDRLKSRKRPKKQQYLSLEIRKNKGSQKTFDARVKLRARSVERTDLNIGSGQELQDSLKAENHKENRDNSYVPNGNSRRIPTLKSHVIASPSYLNSSKLKSRNIDIGNPASAQTISGEFPRQNMSTGFRNGVGRNVTGNTKGLKVIIVAHGRSGSSFFGGIFNAHPDFFFMYEPLNQMKRIVSSDDDEYLAIAEYVLNAILKCNFEYDEFLEIMSREGHHRASCRSLVSPPFCNTTHERAINFAANQNWKLCDEGISAEVLNEICRKHANTATKILLDSFESNLLWILGVSGALPPPPTTSKPLVRVPKLPENEAEKIFSVLYLVRDPRAMIFSRDRLGWLAPRVRSEHALESGEADEIVGKLCHTIELNLGAVLLNPQRIKLIRYEELVTDPEGMVRDLFSELGISPSREVFKWIYSKTHGPVNLDALSLSRNATTSINSWRENISSKLLEIIETRCERVMQYLGYLPTNGSRSILHNLRKPLYLNKMRDLKETYHWPSFMY